MSRLASISGDRRLADALVAELVDVDHGALLRATWATWPTTTSATASRRSSTS